MKNDKSLKAQGLSHFKSTNDYKNLSEFEKSWLVPYSQNRTTWNRFSNLEKAWTLLRVNFDYVSDWNKTLTLHQTGKTPIFNELIFGIEPSPLNLNSIPKDTIMTNYINEAYLLPYQMVNPYIGKTPTFSPQNNTSSRQQIVSQHMAINFVTDPILIEKYIKKFQLKKEFNLLPKRYALELFENLKLVVNLINKIQFNPSHEKYDDLIELIGSIIVQFPINLLRKSKVINSYFSTLDPKVLFDLKKAIIVPTEYSANNIEDYISLIATLCIEEKSCPISDNAFWLLKLCIEESIEGSHYALHRGFHDIPEKVKIEVKKAEGIKFYLKIITLSNAYRIKEKTKTKYLKTKDIAHIYYTQNERKTLSDMHINISKNHLEAKKLLLPHFRYFVRQHFEGNS